MRASLFVRTKLWSGLVMVLVSRFELTVPQTKYSVLSIGQSELTEATRTFTGSQQLFEVLARLVLSRQKGMFIDFEFKVEEKVIYYQIDLTQRSHLFVVVARE